VAIFRKITLSLPVTILRPVKRMAARRQISVSKLLTQTLEEMATREDEYAQGRARHLAWLEHGADLGAYGQMTWSRDSLHER
jgi:hypothetical protein